ncbi:MAG: type IVB secretion system protein DotA [Legionella sp.]|nr:type IVB secretion system protein DotA [Legionella sp.]
MNKLLISILFYFFPALVLADSGAMSFTPPVSDYSVVFLGNLFGIVDGVLHGNGSLIMGAMFGVFNAAVLVFGGIVILYTLIVSTMNTAHEGQMLGQKWSSIWIPLRAAVGLGLLVPKASGYCLMQIFVMWIVLQGVGAADKVWDAALGYLNRGGSIIQAQTTNPASNILDQTKVSPLRSGAASILQGQACMLALQNQLVAQRQSYIRDTQNGKGPCETDALKPFCNTPVPDFLASVNVVDVQNANPNSTTPFTVTMPNIPASDTVYSFLNGICGSIQWNTLFQTTATGGTLDPAQQAIQNQLQQKFADGYKTLQLSRAIAIQQLYTDFTDLTRTMINNDPQIGADSPLPSNADTSSTNFAPYASQQYGIPLTDQGQSCTDYGKKCISWGPIPQTNFSAILTGTEFLNALDDYKAIMAPTLSALVQATIPDADNTSRKFLTEASSRGWIMAGSYFFDMINLNSQAQNNATLADDNSGLDKSTFALSNVTVANYKQLGVWFENVQSVYPRIAQATAIIDGGGSAQKPDLTPSSTRPLVDGKPSSTVYGYINNSLMMQLPGQPGLVPLSFANTIHFSTSGNPFQGFPNHYWNCNNASFYVDLGFFGGFDFCYANISNFVYNDVILTLFGIFGGLIMSLIQQLLNILLIAPLTAIAVLFQQGVATISAPGVNPIVALANMGIMYINFAGDLWISILLATVPAAIFPPIFALMILALPLVIAWMGIMVSISFVTAYYIPILPYMMFVFGAIGWLITVIEAMVAAPIVALGITHPEGHDAFGKGEPAIMILLNIFLRPSMMIIGFIAAIALTYVGVWILNAGYDHAISYMQTGGSITIPPPGTPPPPPQQGSGLSGTYIGWAGLFAFFFSVLTYTTMYLIIVQKSFTLISHLPDKVLRWIGGTPESTGQDAAQWGEEAKSSTKDAGEKSYNAQQQIDKSAGALAQKGIAGLKRGNASTDMKVQSSSNKPDVPPGG